MTSPRTPTTAGLRDQLAGLARGNLAALLVGQGVLALANMAILVMINRVYARPGDTADAGRLAVVISITLAAVLLTTGGVAGSVTRRIARARAAGDEGQSDAIGQSVGGGLVLGAAVGLALMALGLAGPVIALAAARAWGPDRAATIQAHVQGLQLGALWLPSYSMLVVMVAVFDGFQRMRWSLLAETATFHSLRLGAAVVAMLVAGWAWTGLVGAWAAAYSVAVALVGIELSVFLRRRRQPVAWRGLPLASMVRDAFFMFLPASAPMLFGQAGVLVAWVGGGSEASATFWVTWSLSLPVLALCGPVGRVLFPAIPNLRRAADPGEMARVLRRTFWGVSAVALAFVLVVNLVRGWLLAYLHQDGQDAILTVLLAAGFFEVHRVVLNPVLLATGYERVLTLLEWLGLGAILVGGLAAVASGGVMALAWVFLVVYILSAAARMALIARAAGVRLWLDAAVTATILLGGTAVMAVWG